MLRAAARSSICNERTRKSEAFIPTSAVNELSELSGRFEAARVSVAKGERLSSPVSSDPLSTLCTNRWRKGRKGKIIGTFDLPFSSKVWR